MRIGDKTALVWDRGSFLPFAQVLGAEMNVLYFSEWRHFLPYSKDALVGRDMPNVRRVDSFWDHLEEADVVVFPDVGDGDLQANLRSLGKPVWGTGRAEMLELDRANFKRLLETADIALPTIPWTEHFGVDVLEEHLRDPENDDSYVKAGFFRGDLETFHHQSWELTQPWFDELKHKVGPHGVEMQFIVEKAVEALEIGYDGYSIRGIFPNTAMYGYEAKDAAYVGRAGAYAGFPAILRETNAALSGALARLDCRGNYHSEVRLDRAGTAYLNDPCCRAGSPPHEIMGLMIMNWPNIVWVGAHGECIDAEFSAGYGAQVILRSEWAGEHFVSIDVPDEFRELVCLRRAVRYGDVLWHVPGGGLDLVGSALGTGNTPSAAIEEALKVADAVKMYQKDYAKDAGDTLLKLIDDGEERGLNFYG